MPVIQTCPILIKQQIDRTMLHPEAQPLFALIHLKCIPDGEHLSEQNGLKQNKGGNYLTHFIICFDTPQIKLVNFFSFSHGLYVLAHFQNSWAI